MLCYHSLTNFREVADHKQYGASGDALTRYRTESFQVWDFIRRQADIRSIFLSRVKVLSMIPGRIRCFSPLLRGNPENVAALESCLRGFPEIREFTVNPRLGSMLLIYDPEELRKNVFLRELESELHRKYMREAK